MSRRVFGLHGYGEIRTPMFESTELFRKSTGADTDIVVKEMYTFDDRAGRSLTLRPEGTPGVVRALLDAGLVRAHTEIQRYYYIGAMFRYERPQKGRYRQFSQIGVEAFGSEHAALDTEVIQMGMTLFENLGITDASLWINSVGHPECRSVYRERLREALLPHRDDLCEDCRRRLDTNPLRILDCKVASCREITAGAPVILDSLCDPCSAHFDQVQELLRALGVSFEVNPRLVRGLDYYTRTTFEITSTGLGAQNAICGGGRYDGLVASMGGPDTSAVGFAIGSDRLVLEVTARGREEKGACSPAIDVYVVHLGTTALREGVAAAASLRARGVSVRLDPDERDVRKQMSRASSAGAAYALILGDRELEAGKYGLKRLADGVQTDVARGDWDGIRSEITGGGGS